jgi:hypothetical protein
MVTSPENVAAIQSGDEVLSHGPQIALGEDLLPYPLVGWGSILSPGDQSLRKPLPS